VESTSKTHNPWLWIPSLFAIEEILLAFIFYVALLLFVQFGATYTQATLLQGFILLPWVVKSFFLQAIRQMGHYRRWILIAQFLSFLTLSTTAFYLNNIHLHFRYIALWLFLLSVLTAWHTILSSLYYERMLFPRQQRLYNKTKRVVSSVTTIVTYGLLIFFVGFGEIFFRSINRAWGLACYLLAGVMLIFLIANFFLLKRPHVFCHYPKSSLKASVQQEQEYLEKSAFRQHGHYLLLVSFFLLLPQALMLCQRLFYFLAPEENGGLACSLQEVAFAQGTIGVLAFIVGKALSRWLIHRFGAKVFAVLAVILTLSPVFYWQMTCAPHTESMLAFCLLTFSAQFCLGLGLYTLLPAIRQVTKDRHRNTSNMLYVPLVILLMLLPMMLSGKLADALTFRQFFLLDALCAPLAWLFLLLFWKKINIAKTFRL